MSLLPRPLSLLLMAALIAGCVMPKSKLVEDAAAKTTNESPPQGPMLESDAGKRGDASSQCMSAETDAAQGRCCDAPVRCYDGPKEARAIGRCDEGIRPCSGGKLGACEGSVLPRAETCENQGSDDDCDGQLDNVPGVGTSCTPKTDAGECGAGTLACVEGRQGLQCIAETSREESCNDEDDDCDTKIDEAFDLRSDPMNCGACGTRCTDTQACCGGSCVARSSGPSGCPTCSPTQPCKDGKSCCGGECVDWETDPNHCGACGHSCGRFSCCKGACIDTRSDEANCGTCGKTCSEGISPSCCDSACVDIAADRRNCGACGNDCGAVCTCERIDDQSQCRGSLGVCF